MKELKGVDERTVIHCQTQEEWDKVTKLCGIEWKEATWETFLYKSCIKPKGRYLTIEYYENEGYTILPASEFIALNTIPEKWCVKRTPENAAMLNAWYKTKRERTPDLLCNEVFITCDLDFFNYIPNGYTEITFEQWSLLHKDFVKEYQAKVISEMMEQYFPPLLPLQWLFFQPGFQDEKDGLYVKSESYQELNLNGDKKCNCVDNCKYIGICPGLDCKKANEPKGEIIGYKAPFDMYGGEVKKGYIFVKSKDWTYRYEMPYAERVAIGIGQYLPPAEWVETWEPVYKQEPRYELLQDLFFAKKGFIETLSGIIKLLPLLTEQDIKNKPEWFKEVL